MGQIKFNESDLLNKTVTAEYEPTFVYNTFHTLGYRPRFTLRHVPDMLTDPRILLGLSMIKGPLLANARFFVDCDNTELKQFIVDNITRFWRHSASLALKGVDWGYSGAEAMYRLVKGSIYFDKLKPLESLDLLPMFSGGERVGMSIRSKSKDYFLGGPKHFWFTHWETFIPHYGRSRLFGAFLSWIETWTDGGYRDIRRLFMHKNAYDGGTFYHPPGNSKFGDIEVPNKRIAQSALEKKKTGGVLTIINQYDEHGHRMWEYTPPTSVAIPDSIFVYGEHLDKEMLEGMCVPPEIVEASDQGGYAGRRIPQQGFFAGLQDIVQSLIQSFIECCLEPLIQLRFGFNHDDYDVVPFGLLRSEDDGEQATPMQPPEQSLSIDHVTRIALPFSQYKKPWTNGACVWLSSAV